MISYFEADVKCLQDPSLISQFFSLSSIEKVLFLAIVATFSSLISRIKVILIYLRRIKPSSEPLLQYLSEDFDFSDDDDECSSVSSDNEEVTSTMSSRDQLPVDQDFSVAGSSFYSSKQGQNFCHCMTYRSRVRAHTSWDEALPRTLLLQDALCTGLPFKQGQRSNSRLRQRQNSDDRFPLTEFIGGKSVVKLWDLNKQQKTSNMVFTYDARDENNDVVLAAYDTRMRCQFPVICAEWGRGEVVDIGGGEKVYVRDEVGGVLKVGDMRKAKMPVETVTCDPLRNW
ncbi:uncharacterized protein LOC132061440 [Lycium ferocissimum]|uniref:uncharacterized protein LOC132061440 n=1 Tax=Lycium ferocissimum TaxID=112874 RepID=UPI0028161EE3|nr:uncharacterized protein LOC132061440 [Lycium ferocissimum]